MLGKKPVPFRMHELSQEWWHMSLILLFGCLRQKDHELETRLRHTLRSRLKKTKSKFPVFFFFRFYFISFNYVYKMEGGVCHMCASAHRHQIPEAGNCELSDVGWYPNSSPK